MPDPTIPTPEDTIPSPPPAMSPDDTWPPGSEDPDFCWDLSASELDAE